MALDPVTLSVMYFAILLGSGVFLANILKKRNIPDTFFLLMLGLLLGPTVFANPMVTQHFNFQLINVSDM
jgi:Kef-type K+ transport system membrane component KefB